MHDKILMRYTDAQGLRLLVPSKSAVETASNHLRAHVLLGCSATGHHDRRVRLWDPRAPETAMKGDTLGSSSGAHSAWVSGLAWSPGSAFHLLSCSLDGEARVWDVRASVPLHTLQAHDAQVRPPRTTRCWSYMAVMNALYGNLRPRLVGGPATRVSVACGDNLCCLPTEPPRHVPSKASSSF